MSVLFPKVNKPREWDYRPIYFDKEKEARKEKLARLHHRELREEFERHREQQHEKQRRNLILWVAVLAAGLIFYYLLR